MWGGERGEGGREGGGNLECSQGSGILLVQTRCVGRGEGVEGKGGREGEGIEEGRERKGEREEKGGGKREAREKGRRGKEREREREGEGEE